MTTDRHLERDLPAILGEISMGRYPDYIDDVLATTAQRRQRPAWTFPERWLLVELLTTRVPVTRMPWRQVGVLLLLALVLAAALAAYVGSPRQRPLPLPYGPAANGSLLFASGGDIYSADPSTGVSRVIVTGPETDVQPVYSLDGTRVVFGRENNTDSNLGLLFVSRDDGSGLTQITPEPLRNVNSWSFSPDGRSIVAFASGENRMSIVVIPSDGNGNATFFPVFATTGDGPPQYRPDGSEILFIGKDPAQQNRGVYALNPATSNVRAIVAPTTTRDIPGASWSPDGKRVAYIAYALSARTHVVNIDGTGDVAIDTKADSVADHGFAWSNDGTRLIVSRSYDVEGRVARSVVLPIDRSSEGIEIECTPASLGTDCTAQWSWAPDDSLLLGTLDPSRGATSQYLADPQTGKVRAAPWSATEHPVWQRVAPAK